LKDDLDRLSKSLRESQVLVRISSGEKVEQDAVSQEVGDALFSVMGSTCYVALPVEDRNRAMLDVTQVALALAAYRADEGHWPKELKELVPRYAAEIPQDLFAEQPLIYRVDEDQFLLYSRGPNGNDDAGRGGYGGPVEDDISVGNIPLATDPQ
jgi:hypothetical protein